MRDFGSTRRWPGQGCWKQLAIAIALSRLQCVFARTADADCSLDSLCIWANGNKLRLEPAFSRQVFQYKAALDLHAEISWVEVLESGRGECRARRSDAGTHTKVLVVVADSEGVAQQEYNVELVRRSGNEVALDNLSVAGVADFDPTFNGEMQEFSVKVHKEHDMEVSCFPKDMAQSIRVSLNAPDEMIVQEATIGLKSLERRVRSFPVGRAILGGSRFQLLGSQRTLALPLKISIEVWSASAAFSIDAGGVAIGTPATAPGRTYTLTLEPHVAGPVAKLPPVPKLPVPKTPRPKTHVERHAVLKSNVHEDRTGGAANLFIRASLGVGILGLLAVMAVVVIYRAQFRQDACSAQSTQSARPLRALGSERQEREAQLSVACACAKEKVQNAFFRARGAAEEHGLQEQKA